MVGNIENNKVGSFINSNNTLINATTQVKRKDISNYFQLIGTYGKGHVLKFYRTILFMNPPRR